VFADPYKATITKEDGSEVEEDIYEAYNLTLVCLVAACAQIPCGFCSGTAVAPTCQDLVVGGLGFGSFADPRG
jgi:hypothetical protein